MTALRAVDASVDATLEARVAALREGGAEVLGGPAFGLVSALLSRAEALGGAARAHLRARAATRVTLLERELAEGRAGAERALEALREAQGSIPAELVELLSRGAVDEVRRAVRRQLADARRQRRRVELPWAARLHGEARARGAALPVEVSRDLDRLARDRAVAHGAHASAVAVGSLVSSALLSASAESVRATMAVARAADNVPADAGPYNGQVLVARALSILAELAPAYVRALVAGVDDLAALEARLVVEPAKSKPPPKRAAKTAKRRPAR